MVSVLVMRVKSRVRAVIVGSEEIRVPCTAKRVRVYEAEGVEEALARFVVEEYVDAGKQAPEWAEVDGGHQVVMSACTGGACRIQWAELGGA